MGGIYWGGEVSHLLEALLEAPPIFSIGLNIFSPGETPCNPATILWDLGEIRALWTNKVYVKVVFKAEKGRISDFDAPI